MAAYMAERKRVMKTYAPIQAHFGATYKNIQADLKMSDEILALLKPKSSRKLCLRCMKRLTGNESILFRRQTTLLVATVDMLNKRVNEIVQLL